MDNSVADGCISLGDDLARQSDQPNEEPLLLSCELACLDIVALNVLIRCCKLLFQPLKLLDLVDNLVQELLGVVDGARVICSVAQRVIPLRLHIDHFVEELKELSAGLVRDAGEVPGQHAEQEVQGIVL